MSEEIYKSRQKDGAEGIWNRNKNLNIDSLSGVGSSLENTKRFREFLESVIFKYNIKSIIDLPCGDWHWMQFVDLEEVSYLGLDIVQECVESNINIHGTNNIKFKQYDAIHEPFDFEAPDLIICRDFLFHLSTDSIHIVLDKFKKSGAKYLITTTFDLDIVSENTDLTEPQKQLGWGYRHINLDIEPFNLKRKLSKITEPENHNRDQSLYVLNNEKPIPPKKVKEVSTFTF